MHYVCHACRKTYGLEERVYNCVCGGFLELEGPRTFPAAALAQRDTTIWRYREAYGLPDAVEPVSLGEGRTPLLHRTLSGSEVLLKLDFMQPTGAFKDRGASVLISLVRSLGVRDIVEDSSGNSGAAIAAYATAAGMRCTICVPEYTPEGKLVQIRLSGGRIIKVPGTRHDASLAAVEASQRAFYASHLWNPLFCMGMQSSAFEIWEQLGGKTPPAVLVPLGGGGHLEGLFMGFSLLKHADLIEQTPRLIGVQAERCQPLYEAFRDGQADVRPYDGAETLAEGIAVQRPPRARAVLAAVRESGGTILSVTEQETLAALRQLFSLGLFVEPTSATVLAGWLQLAPAQREGAVLILTGTGLKQTAKLSQLFQEPEPA